MWVIREALLKAAKEYKCDACEWLVYTWRKIAIQRIRNKEQLNKLR